MYVCVCRLHIVAATFSSCFIQLVLGSQLAAAFYHLSLTNQITTSYADGHNIILELLYKIPVPGIISTYKVRIVFNRILRYQCCSNLCVQMDEENIEVRLKFNC